MLSFKVFSFICRFPIVAFISVAMAFNNAVAIVLCGGGFGGGRGVAREL